MSTEETTEPIYAPVVDTPTNYVREPAGAHPPLDYPPYKSTALRHPTQPLIYLPHTLTEITGPQLAPTLRPADTDDDVMRAASALAVILFVTIFGAANIYVKALNKVKQQ